MTKQINKVKKFLKGFTLVELIIVIAIVAILSVSAFMTLTKWIGESRDSRRLSDIQTIKKSLTVNYVDPTTSENYPKPDNAQTVTGDSGEKLWYQGYYGSKAAKNTESLSKAPKDPSGTGYEYSTTTDQETYEVYAKLENGDKVSLIINKAYAKDSKYISKVGNYSKYLIGTNGSKYNLYNSPSLHITSGTQLKSGANNKIYQEGDKSNTKVAVTGVDITKLKDNDTTNDDTVYKDIKNKYGLDSTDEAVKVVEESDGDDGNLNLETDDNNINIYSGWIIFNELNVGSYDEVLRKVNIENGNILEEYPTDPYSSNKGYTEVGTETNDIYTTDSDYFLRIDHESGNIKWQISWNYSRAGFAINKDETIIYARDPNNNKIKLISTTDGSILSTVSVDSQSTNNGDVFLDKNENIYIAGDNSIIKVDNSGSKLRNKTTDGSPASILIDKNGDIIVLTHNSMLYKFNKSGSKEWSISVEGDSGLTLDSNNNIYISTRTPELIKYNSNGSKKWSVNINNKNSNITDCRGIHSTLSNKIIMVGNSGHALILSDGTIEWLREGGGNLHSHASSMPASIQNKYYYRQGN